MTAYAKCYNAATMEIRLVRLTRAVKAMLVAGEVHWARRKRGERWQTSDLLIIEHEDTWAKLLPYFDHTAEINRRQHGAKWTNK